MTLLPPPKPVRHNSFYAYVVVDPSTDPQNYLEVKMSRQEARKALEWREEADRLRVRRIRCVVYES